MPRLLNIDDRLHELATGMEALLIDQGPGGLTLRKIAATVGVSPSSLLDRFGTKNHLLRVCLDAATSARLEETRWRVRWQGLVGLLPPEEDAHEEARAWAGWESLGRFEPDLHRTLMDTRAEELGVIAIAAPRVSRPDIPSNSVSVRWGSPPLEAIQALLDGLRWSMAMPGTRRREWSDVEPPPLALSHPRACRLLTTGVAALTGHAAAS